MPPDNPLSPLRKTPPRADPDSGRISVRQPAYRETILAPAQSEYRHVARNRATEHVASVLLAVFPSARGAGLTFADETIAGSLPRKFASAVEEGVRAAAACGVVTGHPVVDVAVSLLDGEARGKDLHADAFQLAGSTAFERACLDAGPVILEPFVALEIVVPQAHAGDVVRGLEARRGVVARVIPRGHAVMIVARAPLGMTFDYVSRLRGLTHGRGTATMVPDGYEIAPRSVVEQLLAHVD
ncbi:hypothetical protein [Pendulispora albinea]|uniref:Elongation factor G n=1 Tax=Pendulispora albinea TaxID=2741071 RepID=A0ABZ2LYT1_9BACT